MSLPPEESPVSRSVPFSWIAECPSLRLDAGHYVDGRCTCEPDDDEEPSA